MTDHTGSQNGTPTKEVKPKVIYVMGSGHSGSTILGVTLNNCDGMFYAGEMDNWLTRRGTSVLGGSERTAFWEQVRERVSGAEELFGGDAWLYLERSSAALRVNARGRRRALRARYRPVMSQLYRAVSEVSGAPYVVDTAHFPLRARELQRLNDIELYLIFLTREPEGVVGSFIRHIGRSHIAERRVRVLRTNFDLWLTHLLAVLVFLRQPRARRAALRHEDFLMDPAGTLREIFQFVDSPSVVPDLSRLNTGFPLQANRLIKGGEVALITHPSARSRRLSLTAFLQAPWQAVFARLRPRIGGESAHSGDAESASTVARP